MTRLKGLDKNSKHLSIKSFRSNCYIKRYDSYTKHTIIIYIIQCLIILCTCMKGQNGEIRSIK